MKIPGQKPGRCLDTKNTECGVPFQNREKACVACQQIHLKNTLNISPANITLNHLTAMGPRELAQYIYKNTLRKKYPQYRPNPTNPLSRGKTSIRTKNFEGLSLGQIFYVFEEFIKTAKTNTQTELLASGLSESEIADHIQTTIDQRQSQDMVIETVLYNISAEKQKETYAIKHSIGKLNNTLFKEYTNERTLQNLRHKFAHFQHIPELTKKDHTHAKLSDQIADIIDKKSPRPAELPDTKNNHYLLEDYFDEVYRIEGLIESDKYLGDGVVREALDNICKNLATHQDVSLDDIVRVDSKNPVRSIEKTVTKNNFDLRKLTDMSRASIKCRTVKDLITKTQKLRAACYQHNKSLSKKSSLPRVEEMGLISKFGSVTTRGPLASGYRDAKYHIKFSNGAVVEVQFQVDVLYEGKTKGFDRLNGLSNSKVIERLAFTDEEKHTIRQAIKAYEIDVGGHDFFHLPDDYKVPGDTIYHIYRALPGFDARHSDNPTIQKLQLYEREIHSEGWLRNIKTVMRDKQQQKHNKKDTALRNKLKTTS